MNNSVNKLNNFFISEKNQGKKMSKLRAYRDVAVEKRKVVNVFQQVINRFAPPLKNNIKNVMAPKKV